MEATFPHPKLPRRLPLRSPSWDPPRWFQHHREPSSGALRDHWLGQSAGGRSMAMDGLCHGKSLAGWWARATPLKNMKVNWDDEIPNINGKIKNGNQTTNQLAMDDVSRGYPHDSGHLQREMGGIHLVITRQNGGASWWHTIFIHKAPVNSN